MGSPHRQKVKIPNGRGPKQKIESAPVRATDGNGVEFIYRQILFCPWAAGEGFIAEPYYSPFTAADGKIPLSMVQVKFKPLYVVFYLRLPG
jgi:hypothetical protein